jgi:acetoin:2,6-dichlorophenolindophenol oxidoreductase subunit alpha
MSLAKESVRDRRERLLRMYSDMYLLRRFDEALVDLAERGLIRGPMHVSTGQEAAGIGAMWAKRDGDIVTATHRPHAQYIGLGLPLPDVLAEMMGREGGQCRGRAGHMLIADVAHGLVGASGVVGHSLLLAVGHAYALRQRDFGSVAFCITGDGAVNSGAFNEALNMAALWTLPLVVVVENNQYALSVPLTAHVREQQLFRRAEGYGMRGVQVDGNDVEAFYSVVAEAAQRARRGQGPSLVEAVTYRRAPFSMSDRGGYQQDEDGQAFVDPLELALGRLQVLDTTVEDIRATENDCLSRLAVAIEEAKRSRWPDPSPILAFALKWDGAV